MIRSAGFQDIPQIIEMAKAFHAESPRYRDIPFIDAHAEQFMKFALDAPTVKRIFVTEADGRITGMMGAEMQVYALFNHDVLFSVDFGFYVRPEYRGTRCAVLLIKEYERWALEAGVKPGHICISESAGISSDEVHEFLIKMGYTLMGRSFRKEQ